MATELTPEEKQQKLDLIAKAKEKLQLQLKAELDKMSKKLKEADAELTKLEKEVPEMQKM